MRPGGRRARRLATPKGFLKRLLTFTPTLRGQPSRGCGANRQTKSIALFLPWKTALRGWPLWKPLSKVPRFETGRLWKCLWSEARRLWNEFRRVVLGAEAPLAWSVPLLDKTSFRVDAFIFGRLETPVNFQRGLQEALSAFRARSCCCRRRIAEYDLGAWR